MRRPTSPTATPPRSQPLRRSCASCASWCATAPSWSRCVRAGTDPQELDAAGVAFRSATEPFDTAIPAGRMMVQMLGVFAEFERATIIDRVIAGRLRSGFFDDHIAQQLAGHVGYRAIQAIPGVGAVLGAVFVAEIGDVARFARPAKLACWAGLTPRHRESDTTVHRSNITKQGSRLVRWAAVEAVQRQPYGSKQRDDRDRIAAAAAASARSPPPANCSAVYYGLRDGEIRCLPRLAA